MHIDPESVEGKLSRRSFIARGGVAVALFTAGVPLLSFQKNNLMTEQNTYDVIIIGGSYAGLSAAMALGRSLRKTLIIDSGLPCNRQTPQSHNLITQDGVPPAEIAAIAKGQVLKYDTVQFIHDQALTARKIGTAFEVATKSGERFNASKILFTAGIKDLLPEIDGVTACWGISVIHCPYCHGYEYSHQKTGILANGDVAFEMGKLISNWTEQLTILTNGKSTIQAAERDKLVKHGINIVEDEIERLEHQDGHLRKVIFKNRAELEINAMYARPAFVQHTDIPEMLNCEFTEQGHIKVDAFQKTTIEGAYAAGDSTSAMRSVSNAISAGAMAGAMINRELIEERF